MLQGSYVISGVVRDPQRNPIPGARIAFTTAPVSLPDIAALSDNNGRFTISVPVPGRYTIQCNTDRFPPALITVEIIDTQEVKLEIQLKQ
jgi:hypothetical protein